MSRKLLSIFLLLALASCTAKPTPIPTPSAVQIETEEQAVYAALLARYPASGYVIMDTTATDITGIENTSQTLDFVLQNMQAVAPETVDSFRVRNETASLLRNDMQLSVPYVLMSLADRQALFSINQDGWTLFYNRYPDAPGIITFSRVGFNEAIDQALCYVGFQSQLLSGAGYYFLLKKVNGNWVVDQQVMTWVS